MKFLPLLFCLLASFLLAACTLHPIPNTARLEAQAEELAIALNLTPEMSWERARTAFDRATETGLAVYAPAHFDRAETLFEEIRVLVEAGKSPARLAHKAVYLERIVDAGVAARNRVEALYPLLFENRKILTDLDAGAVYPVDHAAILRDLDKAVRLVERNRDHEAAPIADALPARMRALEVRVVTHTTLLPALDILEAMEALNRQMDAPKTTAAAKTRIETTRLLIEQDPRARAAIATSGAEALAEARHARQVASAAFALATLDATRTREDVILDVERWLMRVAGSPGGVRIDHLSLPDQADALHEHVARKIAELKETLAAQDMMIQDARKTSDLAEADRMEVERARIFLLRDKKELENLLVSEKKFSESLQQQLTVLQSIHLENLEEPRQTEATPRVPEPPGVPVTPASQEFVSPPKIEPIPLEAPAPDPAAVSN